MRSSTLTGKKAFGYLAKRPNLPDRGVKLFHRCKDRPPKGKAHRDLTMPLVPDWSLIARLLLSAFFGATIGLERYIHGRPAGLRTYLLVCVAFASLAILSEEYYQMTDTGGLQGWRADPARLIAGGLTGIGFLGAGIIIRSGVSVRGLTTAAAIWTVSVIGIAAGAARFQLATVLYIITFASLMLLRYLEPIVKKDMYKRIIVSVTATELTRERLEDLVRTHSLRIMSTDVAHDREKGIVTYSISASGKTERAFHETYRALVSLKDVRSISLQGQDST